MEKVLISACLLGIGCRYDAKAHEYELKIPSDWEPVPFCPEIYGGLPTPRTPAERIGDKVMTSSGQDVTMQYFRGAEEALRLAKKMGIRKAILKERSPSCGKDFIYDGTFTKRLTGGQGVTAELLEENGITIFGESEFV